MENNMENNVVEKEFTFGDLIKLIKRSAVRILIFVLIAAVVMGCVFLGVHFGTRGNNAYVTAQIHFNYTGIEDGLDPLGNTLNVGASIRQNSIVTAAVQALTLGEALVPLVINNLTAEGITVESVDPTVVVFPASYNIRLNNIHSIGLSQQMATKLLEEIVSQYIKYFEETFKTPFNFGSSAFQIATSSGQDYIRVFEMLSFNLSASTRLVESAVAGAAGVENYKSVGAMLAQLRLEDLSHIEFFILENGVNVFDDIDESINRLKARERHILNRIDELDKMRDVIIDDLLANFPLGGITNPADSPNLALNPELAAKFVSLNAEVLRLTNEIVRLETEIENIEHWVEAFEEFRDDVDKTAQYGATATTQTMLNTSSNRIGALVAELETALEEFVNKELAGAVRLVGNVAVVSPTTSASRMTLLAFFAVVGVAAVAAVVTTHIIQKKKGN
jgi:prefoldin subunit 5